MYTCYASAQFKEYKYAVLELKTGGTVVHYLSDKPKLKYDNIGCLLSPFQELSASQKLQPTLAINTSVK